MYRDVFGVDGLDRVIAVTIDGEEGETSECPGDVVQEEVL